MDAIAAGKGYRRGEDYLSRLFPGDDHNEEAWRRRLAIPLEFLLRSPSRAILEVPSAVANSNLQA